MSKTNLDNITLAYSPLTETIYMAQKSKSKNATGNGWMETDNKRPAEKDVAAVIITAMMDDSPKGASKNYMFGDKYYKITVQPIEKKDFRKPGTEIK